MKIRSITSFVNPGWPMDQSVLQPAGEFMAVARLAFEAAGFEVQTVRLAVPPFPELLPDSQTDTVIDYARQLETTAASLGFNYVSMGPALIDTPESFAVIPEVIAATEILFTSGIMADRKKGISLPAVRACAEVIHALAPQDENGFANLYFAALANVPPGAPFFPAAYHLMDAGPTFSIATEAADLAVAAFTQANSLSEARQNLSNALESHAKQLISVVESLQNRFTHTFNPSFGGIDYSLAPFPEIEASLGTALERLGVPKVGFHGSLAAAAFMTDTVDQSDFPRTGFSGLMLPVLEDATLATRAAEGSLSVKDMLLYSAVCGTGLDTVPLPGDTTVAQLTGILLDLSALALRLDKPLTARLMPIPGKAAGDPTTFDFPFFANSRVLPLEAQPLTGPFAGDEHFGLRPRKSGKQ
jgi:uncharacterized protein (UPF0210 family)